MSEIIKGIQVGEWVAKRVQGGYFAERSEAIGLKRDKIVAGVIYENWNHQSIWCHIAIEGRLTPEYLAAIFDYPFNICQVAKIIVPVGSDNEMSTRMVWKMGFSKESCIRDARPEGDIIFWTMHRNDCKYLGDRYGKKLTISAACT